MTEEKINQKKVDSEIRSSTVPFTLGVTNEYLTVNSKAQTKEQVVNQAFKFHSQGNIKEAAKYYQYLIDIGV